MKYCGKCGQQVTEDIQFCVNCGNPVELDSTEKIDSLNLQPKSPKLKSKFTLIAAKLKSLSGKKLGYISVGIVSLLVFIFILFPIIRGYNYKNRSEFQRENSTKRNEIYQKILRSNDIESGDIYVLMFIDMIMTQSQKVFYTFEKLYPDENFRGILKIAVPILYYSYSPKLYKETPEILKEKVTNFIVEYPPYFLGNGEKKYRKYIENIIRKDNGDYFHYYNEENPGKYASGENATVIYFEFLVVLAWEKDFNFGDFKSLSVSDQAKLLKTKAIVNFLSANKNNTLTDRNEMLMDRIKRKWENNYSRYLRSSGFSKFDSSTGFEKVAKTALRLIIDEL